MNQSSLQGYYLAIKRNEKLTHAPMWVNFDYITLTERNQSEKAIYCMIPFI